MRMLSRSVPLKIQACCDTRAREPSTLTWPFSSRVCSMEALGVSTYLEITHTAPPTALTVPEGEASYNADGQYWDIVWERGVTKNDICLLFSRLLYLRSVWKDGLKICKCYVKNFLKTYILLSLLSWSFVRLSPNLKTGRKKSGKIWQEDCHPTRTGNEYTWRGKKINEARRLSDSFPSILSPFSNIQIFRIISLKCRTN